MTLPVQIMRHGVHYVRADEVGPRGGHIAGRTKSGKPIYAPSSTLRIKTRADLPLLPSKAQRHVERHYDSFEPAEHLEAAELSETQAAHHRAQIPADVQPGDPEARKHLAEALAHDALARAHRGAAERKYPGEGPYRPRQHDGKWYLGTEAEPTRTLLPPGRRAPLDSHEEAAGYARQLNQHGVTR